MTRSQIIVLSGVGITLVLTALLSFGFVAINNGLIAFKSQKPELRLEFHTKGDQDRAVHDFFARFAATQGYSFEDTTPTTPPEDGTRTFDLEMQGDAASVTVRSVTEPNRFFVFVYAKNPDPALKGMETRLQTQLRAAWPDAAVYTGP